MKSLETPCRFQCAGDYLYGMLHVPERPAPRGVLVVVGGPQYRVGSHRQFVLLARFLAENGIPVMRFDYRGMGDGEGAARDFEAINDDIRAAIDMFFGELHELQDVVIWGLCDAASAASFYASADPRVSGMVLLNPWVRTDAGIAKAYLKHYYVSRLFDRELWRKVVAGEFNLSASLKSLLGMVTSASSGKTTDVEQDALSTIDIGASDQPPLPDRVYQGLRAYQGRLLFILSGDDLTADEFRDVVNRSRPWRRLLKEPRVQQHELAAANHTFSRREWRDQVAQWTLDWLRAW